MVHFLGDSWRYDQHTRYQSITGVSFRNNRRGWYVSNSEGIARTLDGYDWQLVFPSDTALWTVYFCDTMRGWAAGSHGCVVSTTDGGETWRHEPTSSMTERFLVGVFAVDTGTVYVVGSLRTLLKYTSGGGVEEAMHPPTGATAGNAATIVRGVLLLQVDSRQHSVFRADLLDAMGRKVLDLQPGANDVSRLSSGVYFIASRWAGVGDRAESVRVVIVN